MCQPCNLALYRIVPFPVNLFLPPKPGKIKVFPDLFDLQRTKIRFLRANPEFSPVFSGVMLPQRRGRCGV